MALNEDIYSARREAAAEILGEKDLDGLVVLALPNVRYLTGFTGSNGALLLARKQALFFTDPRYEAQAPSEVGCRIAIAQRSLLKDLTAAIRRLRLRRVGFEANRISFAEHGQLASGIGSASLQPVSGLVETMREVKSAEEIDAIRESVLLNSEALTRALESFAAGMTENALAAAIDFQMRQGGAEGCAFETIVAGGKRTALPHARPTTNALQTDRLLLIDMGARVRGYCSDMTRTFGIGKLGREARRMYKAVLESQLAAIDAVRPGATCASVDGAARDVLRGHKLEAAFVHSTGHGLGLEIHESPRVGRKERTELRPGMVITIEPGVYLEGVGGVRIEDTVVVTSGGCEVLTPTTKELAIL